MAEVIDIAVVRTAKREESTDEIVFRRLCTLEDIEVHGTPVEGEEVHCAMLERRGLIVAVDIPAGRYRLTKAGRHALANFTGSNFPPPRAA